MRLLALHSRKAWELQIWEMATEVGVERVGGRHGGLIDRSCRACMQVCKYLQITLQLSDVSAANDFTIDGVVRTALKRPLADRGGIARNC
jgi:hypothetical protein